MADISKCNGDGCPKKDNCYRYTAPSSEHWQAYFTLVPYNHTEKKCDVYWPLEEA